MNSPRTFFLLLIALFIFSFGLAADLQPRFRSVETSNGQSDNFFNLLLGDSSRLFANSFATKADAYYHSGFYPTIFDNNTAFKTLHMAEDTGAVASHNKGDETSFMGPPRNWLDAFGRHFIPNRHTHLDEGGPTGDLSKSQEVREILPWLKLSTDLDPQNIQTYLITAFFLRERMNKVDEAEQVLRDGLRNNPGNPQLLFELGQIYYENYHNLPHARNIWEGALQSWEEKMAGQPDSVKNDFDNRFIVEQLQTSLGVLENDAGNLQQAIEHFQAAQKVSNTPALLQKRVDEVKTKMAALSAPAPLY